MGECGSFLERPIARNIEVLLAFFR
jgi:hypothetical protein